MLSQDNLGIKQTSSLKGQVLAWGARAATSCSTRAACCNVL